nr:UDP-GlcNAc:betaGal beta-1,3-N-acetylglucosaminyltransferase-like protein 1 isoform X8 [Equus caballus]
MEAGGQPAAPHVSVILPVHNAEAWLDECLRSVLQQDFEGSMELSVFNDASKDKSMTIIEKWKVKLEDSGILVVIGGHDSPSPRGVGYSKNQAIAQSSGSYLCFLDSDDAMMPQRVRLQHEAAVRHPTSIIGCQVRREPPNSTERYTRWINQLASDQLLTQVFTSHGPTVVMPTWFCSREWFSHVGPFDEGGQGVPEDLLFFYSHLRKGGGVVRVDQSLLIYRYHPKAATHSVLERIGDSVLPPEGMSFAGRCGFSTGILCPGRADVHLHGGCHVHCHNRAVRRRDIQNLLQGCETPGSRIFDRAVRCRDIQNLLQGCEMPGSRIFCRAVRRCGGSYVPSLRSYEAG